MRKNLIKVLRRKRKTKERERGNPKMEPKVGYINKKSKPSGNLGLFNKSANRSHFVSKHRHPRAKLLVIKRFSLFFSFTRTHTHTHYIYIYILKDYVNDSDPIIWEKKVWGLSLKIINFNAHTPTYIYIYMGVCLYVSMYYCLIAFVRQVHNT